MNFEGPFSRWIALLGDSQGRLSDALTSLDAIADRLPSLNALDQAEVLAARIFIKHRIGLPHLEDDRELRDHLSRLPSPIADHLVRMRVLLMPSAESTLVARR